MKIYLDTNAISKVGHIFSKPQYLKIAKLCADHGYSVVLHEIAKREIESQITDQLKNDIYSAKIAIDRICRKANSTELKSEISNLSVFFEEKKRAMINDKLINFHNWLSKCKTEIVSLSSTNTEAIFEDYFEGRGAFSSIKNRNDIPDSFILHGLVSLGCEPDDIVVICDDGNLAKSVVGLGYVNVFKCFDDFIKSDTVKDINFDFFMDHLRLVYDDVFERVVSTNVFRLLIKNCIADHDWDEIVLNDDYDSEPRITGIGEIHNLEIELIEASNNEIRVKCNYDADVDLEYFISKSDACCMGDDDLDGLSFTDWNKYVFQVSKSTTLSFEIECGVYVDEDFTFSAETHLDTIIESMLGYSSCGVEYVWVSEWQKD